MAAPSGTFRLVSLFMGLYFAFACAVQANDPDAAAWGGLYGASAALTFASAWRTPPVWAPGLLTLVAVLWAASLMSSAFQSSLPQLFSGWEMMSPEMEVGREFLGLIILAVWMAMLTLNANLGRGGVESSSPR